MRSRFGSQMLALGLAAVLVGAAPGLAQSPRPSANAPKREAPKKSAPPKKKEQPKEKPPEAPAKPAPAPEAVHPYDAQLNRLATAIGALTFLSDLCQAGDGDDWRDKMRALLDADAPEGARRQQLIGAFNRGFRGFELTYHDCTPNARAAINRYLSEADRIAADMTYRYGAQ